MYLDVRSVYQQETGQHGCFCRGDYRGFGKSRVLSGVAREWAKTIPSVALITATSDDGRRVLIEGPSGVMASSSRWDRPVHKKVDRLLEWPNGARTYMYSAESYERLRGANNGGILADELCSWLGGQPDRVWEQAMLTLRIGKNPRAVIATTPRPIPLLRSLASAKTTFLTTGSSRENEANLASQFFTQIITQYAGTRLEAQEINGEILLDVSAPMFGTNIKRFANVQPADLVRCVVGVDPAGGTDQCGIVVAGTLKDGSIVICEDCTMPSKNPVEWAAAAVKALDRWQGDSIIAETNYGGAMVLSTLRQFNINTPVRLVNASRGKLIRAEPVALLFEQQRAGINGHMPVLEQQMSQFDAVDGWTGKNSPDNLDAAVWAVSALIGGRAAPTSAMVASVGSTSNWRGRA